MSRRAQTWLLCAALAAGTLLLYAQVAWHPFILFDDTRYVTENPMVLRGLSARGVAWAFTALHASNWHPLTWLSHMLDVQLFGAWAGGHHLVNALLHAANAAVLFLVLLRLTGSSWRSAAVAALFAVHPLHVESVAWVAERKDVLSTLFGFLALLEYAREQRRIWLVSILFGFSLLAKPMWVTLPFLLLLLDAWPLARGLRVKEKLPLFGLSLGSCVMTVIAQRGAMTGLELPLGARVANAVFAYAAYLGKTLWPAELSIHYPYRIDSEPAWVVAVCAALLVAVSGAAFALRRRMPWIAVGWCWFLGTLVPVIGLLQVGTQAMADRYTYLPLVGLFIAAIFSLPARAAAAVPVVLAVLCALTFRQLGYWQSHETLFRHALAVDPDDALAHGSLSVALRREGRLDEALQHAVEAATLDPGDAGHWMNLAVTERKLGRIAEALQHLQRCVSLDPQYAAAWGLLGQTQLDLGAPDEALVSLQQAVHLDGGDAQAWTNLALLLQWQGRPEESIDAFRSAARADPQSAVAWSNLGVALSKLGQYPGAADAFARALRLRPGDPDFQRRFAEARGRAGP